MKFAFLIFTLMISLSAFTANTNKTSHNHGNMNAPTAKPANNEMTQLDDLVRGELAAVKAYDQALADLKDEKQKSQLQAIRKDHVDAASVLSKYAAGKKDILEDTQSSGPWGTFAKSWVKGRGVAGNEGAMKALQDGEEHGINEYEEALEDESLPKDLKEKIRTQLMPNQKKHIQTLKTFM